MNGSIIGVPREARAYEGRVALTPDAVSLLVGQGNRVVVEKGAGELCGFPDDLYIMSGGEIAPDAPSLYGVSRLIVKVKEPQPGELAFLRDDHILFCFLHLAADHDLMDALCEIGLTAIAFETVEVDGRLPLLAPMSKIAGKIAVQIGARLLHQPEGGKGVLLGGVGEIDSGHVVVIGGGMAGSAAIQVASALGARVTVLEHSEENISRVNALGSNVNGMFSTPENIEEMVASADLLIGAVLVKGDRTPKLVSAEMIRQMEAGGVVIDISVDQGGCIETTRPTNYDNPTHLVGNVIHFGVTNMPGAVPRTSSQALSAVILPWVTRLARPDWRTNHALVNGINVDGGEVVYATLRSK